MGSELNSKLMLAIIVAIVALLCGSVGASVIHFDVPQLNLGDNNTNNTTDNNTTVNETINETDNNTTTTNTQTYTTYKKPTTPTKNYTKPKKTYNTSHQGSENTYNNKNNDTCSTTG
ncbi:hypothetical protein [Methanosphaera cuniculi]|uniref:Uncharacterized protein n=1 Tax=Methanosphaera cuniculi TaxID=1077256 RepID=A0A2A2HC52_9EURY|nr:hypothetical protein [Methanosphaera cuniculi]PAV06947.1 hypothetical protein ASJ82_07500 [Methanosphaera cuniculi]PWL08719.1 hypothetical protein MSCUN_04320 [Methanosphaera cuniculi]